MITVSEEKAIDYALTARLATEAFASPGIVFAPERVRWLYESGFGNGAIVVSAFDDGRKVGQVALLRQTLRLDGETFPAVQLVDLFVTAQYRSSQLVRRLYREVEEICRARGIRYMLALPNDKSVQLNARLLKLAETLSLPARIGVSLLPPSPARLRHSGAFRSMSPDQATALFADYLGGSPTSGLHWDAQTLFARLSDPARDYAVHATETALLISATRRVRGARLAVLCAFFARPQAAVSRQDVRHLVRAACRFWRAPLFAFAGINADLPHLPGMPLPARLRRPILVQLRDIQREPHGVRFSRFQLIDSDFV